MTRGVFAHMGDRVGIEADAAGFFERGFNLAPIQRVDHDEGRERQGASGDDEPASPPRRELIGERREPQIHQRQRRRRVMKPGPRTEHEKQGIKAGEADRRHLSRAPAHAGRKAQREGRGGPSEQGSGLEGGRDEGDGAGHEKRRPKSLRCPDKHVRAVSETFVRRHRLSDGEVAEVLM